MEWVKRVRWRDAQEPWREDFPLAREMPDRIALDLSEVRPPLHPMALLRMRMFIDRHERLGREVEIVPPADRGARILLEALRFAEPANPTGFLGRPDPPDDERAIVPITRLVDDTAVEEVASLTRQVVEYHLTDVAPLGAAAHMAVSELCGNAVEHGSSDAGAYIALVRRAEPRRQVTIAVADLGIGIPEHLRREFPEYSADDHVIALAMQPRVSGTGHPHRGNGFSEIFEAALAATLHAARIEIHSASGFVRREIVQERVTTTPFPGARYKRGTWIVYDLVTALA